MISSQKVTFPYPTHRMCVQLENECELRKGIFFFKWKRIEWKNSHKEFHACICCGLFVRASESWKKLPFFVGEKSDTKGVLPFSCNFMKNTKQYPAVLFACYRGDISLPNVKITDKIASIFFIFNWISKILVLYVKRMVILFVSWNGLARQV